MNTTEQVCNNINTATVRALKAHNRFLVAFIDGLAKHLRPVDENDADAKKAQQSAIRDCIRSLRTEQSAKGNTKSRNGDDRISLQHVLHVIDWHAVRDHVKAMKHDALNNAHRVANDIANVRQSVVPVKECDDFLALVGSIVANVAKYKETESKVLETVQA